MAETGFPQPTQSPDINIAEGKEAFQSSTMWGMAASLAVDGNTDGDYFQNSCTHTEQWVRGPAWWVDLGQSYDIGRVVIFNRQDYGPDRLNPFNIHIGDSNQITSNPKCGGDHEIDVNQPSISVSCQSMTGRYVGVRLPGEYRTLTLCEVQVFSGTLPSAEINTTPAPAPDFNIARGKQAYQSSVVWEKVAALAVDGDTNTDYYADSCQHNAGEANPSWWVDLGKSFTINRVVIFNRQDYEPERLNPFNIHIGGSDQVIANPQCGGDHQIDVNQPSISVFCQGMTGRYVGVRLPGEYRSLTLCEVQVFSGPTTLPQVAGYTVRAGDCRGNDIWSIAGEGLTLSQCASRCSGSSQCVAFQFSNGNCYPKTATCSSPITDNPPDTFYDKEAGSLSTVGYTERAGSFYKVFRTRKDHTSAQQTCETDGGHLAVVNTEALNNFIVGLISDFEDFWIGLSGGDTDGNWRWADGTRLGVGCAFTNWAPYEPSDNNGQNCVQMWSAYDYKWDDDFCYRQKYFICQIESCQVANGASYRGTVAVTVAGKTCQRWDSQTPHGHDRTPANYPEGGLVDNYCRNPDGWYAIWCYTTDPSQRWDYCDVPVC
uniref:Uncharacterized protein n=1 Tax=Branchiostoma floridae TaxID=7739 RepID=C3YDL9_BRAFL|eukprot:XP_002605478.1 hypothetical protein BRAFLDRAFT_92895 [Branchiostoma floridae]